MTSPEVSVVIPTYNRAESLERLLSSLQAQQGAPGFEVLVVNDGSTDRTAALLAEWAERYPGWLRFFSGPRRGPAAARNIGIREAWGRIVAFTDDDCLPEPTWLRELTAPFAGEEPPAGVGGQTLPLEPDNIWSRYQDRITMRRPHEGAAGITFLMTNNAAFPRDRLRQIGGFDETFFMAAAEDVDLSRRLRAAGGRLVYQPAAVLRHRNITTLTGYLKMCYRYAQGEVLLHRRHPAWYKILRTLWWSRHLLEIVTLPLKAVRFRREGALGWSEAILMALLRCGQETIGFLGALSMIRYIVRGEDR